MLCHKNVIMKIKTTSQALFPPSQETHPAPFNYFLISFLISCTSYPRAFTIAENIFVVLSR